jgi:hypothetical protein
MLNKLLQQILLQSTILLLLQNTANAQVITNQKKIEAIVNLTRFVDWSHNKSFINSKKRIYVLTEISSEINYEYKTSLNSEYKDWQIICSEKLLDFECGSVIFITNSKKNYANKVIGQSGSKDLLTISDNMEEFCRNGGMINLQENKDKLKFEINYRIIQNKSLDISSKLLALSKIYD